MRNIRIHLEERNLGLYTALAIVSEGADGRLFALNLQQWQEVSPNNVPTDEVTLKLGSTVDGMTETLYALAQRLWDLGYRPRVAINHEKAIEALQSERDFLRKLVMEMMSHIGQLRDKALNVYLETLARIPKNAYQDAIDEDFKP